MPKEFGSGLLGCLSDPRLCILTFCVPCYTAGRNAQEGHGEDCLLIGLLTCLGLNFGAVMRWRLRQNNDLEGSMITDVLIHLLLPCCGMIQEAKEIGWALPKEVQNVGKKREQEVSNQAMARE